MSDTEYENVTNSENKIKPKKIKSKKGIKFIILLVFILILVIFINPFYILNLT